MLVVVVVARGRRVAVPPSCPMTALMSCVLCGYRRHLRAAATSVGCTIWPVVFDQWFFV